MALIYHVFGGPRLDSNMNELTSLQEGNQNMLCYLQYFSVRRKTVIAHDERDFWKEVFRQSGW